MTNNNSNKIIIFLKNRLPGVKYTGIVIIYSALRIDKCTKYGIIQKMTLDIK